VTDNQDFIFHVPALFKKNILQNIHTKNEVMSIP